MKNKVIHFGLIGAGRMGKRWATRIAEFPGVSLKTISSKNYTSANELANQFPNCQSTKNVEDIFRDKEIDALVIATPHDLLSPLSSSALKAGKHVLCEKPGAIKSVDIRKNINLAHKNSLVYMVGYNHRFHDGFLKARREFERGTIGDLVFIRARYGFGGRVGYDLEWRLDKNISGGGHLIDQGIHMIDLALSFMGKPTKVEGFISDTFWKKGAEDNAFVLLQNKDKVTASIHSSLTQWKALHCFEIYGTKGYLSVEGLGMKYSDNGEVLVIGKHNKNFTKIKEKVINCNSVADDSLTLELKEFISAIKEGRVPTPSPLESYEALKIVEKIYKNNI